MGSNQTPEARQEMSAAVAYCWAHGARDTDPKLIGTSQTLDAAGGRLDSVPWYGWQKTAEGEHMSDWTIGRAARRAGVGVETIRFYERRGLIEQPPKPARSVFRVYSEDTVARIRFIRQAQELGFSLREVGELLGLKADPAADAADVRNRAAAKLEQVEEKIRQLERIRGALEALIAACPGKGELGHCSIMEALQRTRADGEIQDGSKVDA